MIRLTIPSIEEDDLQAVRGVLQSGYLVQGPQVAAFEQAVASYLGVGHAVAVANCTAALHLSLLALGVGQGDRVAVAAYSFPATANVIALCGAEPIFVDIDPRTYNMDPDALEQVLRKTAVKAVLPVHAFGGMASMPVIQELADQYGAPVVEDAACALGAELNGRKAGTWGTFGCFSFHPRKAITTGEGGMIVTGDPGLARTLRALRNHGLDPAAPAPDFIMPGYNVRLTDFQAALGRTQLQKLERIIVSRQSGAARYAELLAGLVDLPGALADSRHVYQSYVVLVPRELVTQRAAVIDGLRSRGVEATIGTYHIPMTTYFRSRFGFGTGCFPVADEVADRAVSLPLFEGMTDAEQMTVASALREVLETCR